MTPVPSRRSVSAPLAALLATLLWAPSTTAQQSGATQAPAEVDHLALGKMWTFENPPLGYLQEEYGFAPDEKWLDSLRMSALRLGERGNPWCSASFVSPKGLIMTNHHCVRDEIAKIQGPASWVEDGFAATALEDEVAIPGLTVQQLIAQEDVSARVDDGVDAAGDAVAQQQLRQANIDAIVAAADQAHPEHMHEVVALYHGAEHQLYRYRVWDDLRLVVAPHLQAAHFGGDPDNFTYPRWSIDFAFVRAYLDGAPADTSAHYFRWRERGAVADELVFVPGNPGSTNRQLTVSQLELQRDVEYPMVVEQFADSIAILEPFKDRAPALLTTLLSWQNTHKAVAGMLRGLRDEALMAKKRAHERHFRAAIAADAQLNERFGDTWQAVDALVEQQRLLLPRAMFHQPSFSGVLERGLLVARALDDEAAAERRAEAAAEARDYQVGSSPLTHSLLLDHFQRAERWLPQDDAFLQSLAGDFRSADGTDWAAALGDLRDSALTQQDFVDRLLAEGGGARWRDSDDVGVRAARALHAAMTADEELQQRVDSALSEQVTRLGHALHAVYGSSVSPDATMTLRFSDGRVRGYPYNGTLAPWATTFYGLYGRSASFGGAEPFDLPAAWQQARDRIDLSRHVCFASTNDIVGGNSGSCVVDRDLRVVGLVFDGNIESLANDFYFTQRVARAVSVHTDAIVEALQKVYRMGRVVEELRTGATR